MITLLLVPHIIALSISLVATLSMVIAALFSRATPQSLQRVNLAVTSTGILLGFILLLQNPLGSRCLELSAYLIAFSFAYRFVRARSARLSSSSQVAS